MKITAALQEVESPVLIRMRRFLAKAPDDSVFTLNELAKKMNASKEYIREFAQMPEFADNKIRHKHGIVYGSRKAIAAYQKAREALANKD